MRERRVLFSIVGFLAISLLVTWFVVHRRLLWPLATMMAAASPGADAEGPTVINVSPVLLHDHVIRLGMNLGNQDFYDSQQISKNLISENPGFEGQQWQTVLQCGKATSTSCTDAGNSGGWPEGFLDGGTFEVLTGAATGEAGAILHSTVGDGHASTIIQFGQTSKPLGKDDFIAVRKTAKGDAAGGWNKYLTHGAAVATEYDDLSPSTTGSQALRINTAGTDQFASISAAFDSTNSRSYIQLRGPYRIRFRAKGISGGMALNLKLERSGTGRPLFEKDVSLSNTWKDYSFDFTAQEPIQAVGTVSLGFSVVQTNLLLDDVSLEEATSNGTAFRDDVVATLQRLKPGVLRYMDSGQNFGSSLDNMLAPQEARQRSGFNRYSTTTNGVPTGLHDFLVLCEKLGAEPWYTMQIGMSTQEAANIMEYLGGPVTTKYGATRAALGHPLPWTQTFPRIHLEYGNEAWNTAQPGATIPDSPSYASRTNTIFQIIRSSQWFVSDHFNLIANTQSVWEGRTIDLLKTVQGADTLDIAPYLFSKFADDSSIEHIFGPMFAQPQLMDNSVEGDIHRQAHAVAVARNPVHLAVYEANMGTVGGTVGQASINSTVPSIGAGIAVVEHELLMLRDAGITVQNTFQLGGGDYPFNNSTGIKNETSPIWGVVVDMGGPTNRVRPTFLAQQLVNQAIRPAMLVTSVSGENPTWDQPESPNDNIGLVRVLELQTFAFADQTSTTLVVVNLSRNTARTVRVDGPCSPQGKVQVQTLTSAKITDSNELQENVKTLTREEQNVVPGKSTFTLPPFSITSLSSNNAACMPTK